MSTATESKLVTYTLPDKLPRSKKFYANTHVASLVLRVGALQFCFYFLMSVFGVWSSEDGNSFSTGAICFFVSITLLIAGLVVRSYAVKRLKYFYQEVQQGVVTEQNCYGSDFRVTIQGNNRMNESYAQSHSVNAGDWFRSVMGFGPYSIDEYADFRETSTD